jgi:hypothetical protein
VCAPIRTRKPRLVTASGNLDRNHLAGRGVEARAMPMGALGTGVNARVIPPRLAGVDRDHLGDTPGLGRHGAGKVPRGRQHRDFLRRQPGDLIHLESHQRLLEVRLDGVLMRRLLESFLVLLQDFAELGTQRRIVRRQGAQRPTELPDYSAGSPAASAAPPVTSDSQRTAACDGA